MHPRRDSSCTLWASSRSWWTAERSWRCRAKTRTAEHSRTLTLGPSVMQLINACVQRPQTGSRAATEAMAERSAPVEPLVPALVLLVGQAVVSVVPAESHAVAVAPVAAALVRVGVGVLAVAVPPSAHRR